MTIVLHDSEQAVVDLLDHCCRVNPGGTVEMLYELAEGDLLDVAEAAPGVWLFRIPGGAIVAEVHLRP